MEVVKVALTQLMRMAPAAPQIQAEVVVAVALNRLLDPTREDPVDRGL